MVTVEYSHASVRPQKCQGTQPKPATSAREQTNNKGRFHDAAGRGPQKQSVFTVLQYGHDINFAV